MFRQTALRVTVVFCALLGFSAAARSELIVGYTGTKTPVTTTASGVESEDLTRSSGVTANNATNYSTIDWTTGGALDSTDYLEWGFTSTSGYTYGIDLTALDIQYSRTGSGPKDLLIQASINGGAFATIPGSTSTLSSAATVYNPSISLTQYDQVTSAIFRLYAYNANNGSGQLDLTNFTKPYGTFAIAITGLAATPEPTSLAVFGLGAAAAGYVGWRRRKATAAQKA